MTDLALAYDPATHTADLCIADGDLVLDDGLSSLVLMSLLTDARAAPEDVDPGEQDLRGWWGDAFSERALGGRLWTLGRALATDANARRPRGIEELQRVHQEQLYFKQLREEAEKREADEFRAQMMAKFAEDDRIEQMNAHKRRMKLLEHKRAVEELLKDRHARFEAARVRRLKTVTVRRKQ